MVIKFIMRDEMGAVVSGTPTVTADGAALTPTGTSARWQVDAPLGTLVTFSLAGAETFDVLVPAGTGGGGVPLGYVRITSVVYGELLPGTVLDAYLVSDTARLSPVASPPGIAAVNGSWSLDVPTGDSYALVGRLPNHATTVQVVTV